MKLKRNIKRCLTFILISIVFGLVLFLTQSSEYMVQDGTPRAPIKRRNETGLSDSRASDATPILLWWDSVYTSVDDIKTCRALKCHVTNDRRLHQHPATKVYLFYGSHFKPYNLPLPRKAGDIWALIHEESPRNAYILSHNNTMGIFNVTSSYNRKSNYPITTQWLQCSDWLQDTEFLVSLTDKNKLRRQGMAPILYLHSDCGVPSDRDHFVKLLQKYINVDSYGTCLRNRKIPERLRFRDTMAPLDDVGFFRWAARYKFTLAMENYVCNDYVTEKLWRPLRLGSVPIVFGAPNVKEFLPDNNSAVVIEDFADIQQLAAYIHKLDKNDSLYLTYLQFKTRELQNKHLADQLVKRDWNQKHCKNSRKGKYLYESIFDGFECYLCKLAHNVQKKETVYQANSSHFHCPAPKRFNEQGKYLEYSDIWAEEWTYGKYEAVVMEHLINENKVVSKKEFDNAVKKAMPLK